jgi:hypothetical protein
MLLLVQLHYGPRRNPCSSSAGYRGCLLWASTAAALAEAACKADAALQYGAGRRRGSSSDYSLAIHTHLRSTRVGWGWCAAGKAFVSACERPEMRPCWYWWARVPSRQAIRTERYRESQACKPPAGAGAPRQWHVGNFGLPDRLHLTHFVLCRLELSPWPLPASRSQRRLCVVRPACGEPIRSVDHHRPRRSYFTAKVTQLRLAIFTQSRVSGDWSSGHHHGGVARPPGVMSARGRPAQRKPWLDVGVAVGGREGVCPADESTKRFDNRFPQRGVAIGTPTKFSTSPHPKGESAAAPPYEGWPRRPAYTVTEISARKMHPLRGW